MSSDNIGRLEEAYEYRGDGTRKTACRPIKGRKVEWAEPFGPNDEPVLMSIAEGTAIACQKYIAAKNGHTYSNDAEALNDFMVVHWAEFKEEFDETSV